MPTPLSTYRIQFRNGMSFSRAEALLPYLERLGITHLYASPVFRATEGSTHGYDVTDPNLVDPVIGGRQGLVSLARALKARGLHLLLDIVPNHMAASLENPWWRDVIEWGRSSRHAAVFDIDWEQRLTLPFLGAPFDKVAEQGDITLAADRERGSIVFRYFDNLYPLNPSTYMHVFRDMGGEQAETLTLLSKQAAAEAEEIFHGAIRALLAGPGGEEIDRHLERLSQDRGFLARVHDLQSYRLMDWREAARGLSYRRFFEIAGLVGVRVEDPAVFEAMHATVFELLDEGLIDGLRIDHIDGLADPRAYLDQLRQRIGPDRYLIVEKILASGETIPDDWPVDGTTGYEFVSALAPTLAHEAGAARLESAYRSLAPENPVGADAMRAAKRLMMEVNFSGEMQALTRLAHRLMNRGTGTDVPEEAIRRALAAVLEDFPVYRTYGTASDMPQTGANLLDRIAAEAAHRLAKDDRTVLAGLIELLKQPGHGDATSEFRIRFQQLSGPLMAKSLEDTLFYRHNAFLAFNEVGGELWSQEQDDPDFHGLMSLRLATHPLSLNATATHDTKRGEDARARLLALSEDPERWISGVSRWRDMARDRLPSLEKMPLVEPQTEWMIFQALAGAWPSGEAPPSRDVCTALLERLQQFLQKAAREAKLASNWNAINADYEAALGDYASSLLDPLNDAFRRDFHETLKPFIRAGEMNALTQAILKLTAPGIPDIYQGSEQQDFSFVDPDNRRLPDFDRLSGDLPEESLDEALDLDPRELRTGRLKQKVIARLLHLRRHFPSLFLKGDYRPLAVEGENRSHLLAFLRRHEGRSLIVAVPLKTLCLERGERCDPGEGRTRVVLPEDMLAHGFTDLFTGRDLNFPDRDENVSGFAAAGYSLMFGAGN